MPKTSISLQHAHQQLKLCEIPARHVLAVLTFFGMVISFAMMVILNVSIVAMVDNTDVITTDHPINISTCAELMPKKTNDSHWNGTKVFRRRDNYKWDFKTQSIILSSLYYGLTASMIPGAVLAQKFGGKWSFSIAVLITSVLTLLTPQAAELGVIPLVLVRVLEGLVLGTIFPARNVLISRWIPIGERSRFMTISMNGTCTGNLVGMLLGGVLADLDFLGGWPATFYVFGFCGCLWFVFWTFLVYEDPSFHPLISETELDFIQSGVSTTTRGAMSDIPWMAIIKSIPAWILYIAVFGNSWANTLLLTELPTYLSNVLHFDMKMNGLFSSLPYALQVVVVSVAGPVADKLIGNGTFTLTTVRKIMNSVGFYACGICILLVAFVGCREGISVGLLSVANAFCGLGICVCATIMVDMSPDYTAPLTGIAYTIYHIVGSIAPYAVGEFVNSGQTMENWNKVFIITTVISFSSVTIFNVFGSAEVQPWGFNSPENKSENTGHQCMTNKIGSEMDSRNEITKL